MNNSIFIFKLNDNEQIIVKVDEYSIDVPYCFYEAHFYMIQGNHEVLLSYDSLASHIEGFIIALNLSLQNKRQIDLSLAQNIGYYWNESINGPDEDNPFNENYSILKKYTPWGAHTSTWLYNNASGDIILEITPYYPHTYSIEYSYQDFLEWMKNYKPLFKTIIPRKTAQQWLAQATQILTTIDENSELLHAQGKL